MLLYIAKRIAWGVLVIVGITVIMFVITQIIPADPARVAAGLQAREEQVEEMRRQMGLDKPMTEQFAIYISGLASGDLGRAARSQRPIVNEIKRFLPASIELVLFSMFLSVIVGVLLGIIGARTKSTFIDKAIQFFSLAGMSMPLFWVALILQFIFYSELQILPAGGRLPFGVTPPPNISGLYTVDSIISGNMSLFLASLKHLVMPAVALSLSTLANTVRITKRSFQQVLSEEYIRTARAKGLEEYVVVFKHAFKNAGIPIVTMTGLQTGWLFSSSILVEVVFGWPGLGKYAVDAIEAFDFNAIMGVTLVIAILFVLINLLVDIIYSLLDPRICY